MGFNKRGVSIIVGYTLLIVIAIGLSIGVFTLLKSYVPKDTPECKSDVKIIIQDAVCDLETLTISLKNKGLFKADALYVRAASADREVRVLLNPADLYLNPNDRGLKPGQEIIKDYTHPELSPGEKMFEIQPAVFDGNDLAICEQAIVVQPITCS
jgi:hypothetical protein